MFANRLLRFAHGAQELIIYDFLERLYQPQLARNNLAGASRNTGVTQPAK